MLEDCELTWLCLILHAHLTSHHHGRSRLDFRRTSFTTLYPRPQPCHSLFLGLLPTTHFSSSASIQVDQDQTPRRRSRLARPQARRLKGERSSRLRARRRKPSLSRRRGQNIRQRLQRQSRPAQCAILKLNPCLRYRLPRRARHRRIRNQATRLRTVLCLPLR